MRLTRSVLLLAILASAALAQPGAPPKKPGLVAGIVTNSVTGQPVKKATVTLNSPTDGSVPEHFAYVALTDAEGHFKMPSVEPAQGYTFTLRCPGFQEIYSSSDNPISVNEEQAVTAVKLELTPLGIISGEVVDADGAPIPGAFVQATQFAFQWGARQIRWLSGAQTDDRGFYRLYDLPAGRTFVAVSVRQSNSQGPNIRLYSDRPEDAYPTVFYPQAADLAGASATTIAPGAEIAGVNFRLKRVPVYHIRGKAIDAESRQPVHGARVQLAACPFEQQNYSVLTAQLQQDGTFDLSGVLPGQQCLRLQPAPNSGSFGQQTVSVNGQDVNGVVLPVWPAGELHGRVLVESTPPPGSGSGSFQVQLYPLENISTPPFATANSDNIFVVTNVFPVSYTLHFQMAPGFYLKSIQYGERDASDGRIDVTSAGASLTLVAAADTAKLSVTAQAADGSPASNVSVILAPSGKLASRHDLFHIGYTGPTGVAIFFGVAPGDYKIFAVPNLQSELAEVEEFRKILESRAGSVSLHGNDNQSVQVQTIPAELIDEATKKLQ